MGVTSTRHLPEGLGICFSDIRGRWLNWGLKREGAGAGEARAGASASRQVKAGLKKRKEFWQSSLCLPCEGTLKYSSSIFQRKTKRLCHLGDPNRCQGLLRCPGHPCPSLALSSLLRSLLIRAECGIHSACSGIPALPSRRWQGCNPGKLWDPAALLVMAMLGTCTLDHSASPLCKQCGPSVYQGALLEYLPDSCLIGHLCIKFWCKK